MQEWTEEDFDDLSWHDCHVHAWRIEAVENGHATLILDIDFITAWVPRQDGSLAFRLAPATLEFREVFGLSMTFDYIGCALTPLSVGDIQREARDTPAGSSLHFYHIGFEWPAGGFLRFESQGFHQVLRAEPILSDQQYLDPSLRPPMVAGI